MPTKDVIVNSPRKNGVTLPIGSLVVTLLAAKDWKTKDLLLGKTLKSNKKFETGAVFACSEKFGGNTLNLVYPFIHVSGENTITRNNALSKRGDNCKEWIEQSVYVELDKVASGNRKSSISEYSFVIFIGLHMHQDAVASKLESTWKHWSKIGFVCSELRKKAQVPVEQVIFLRQILAPKCLRSSFHYCLFIGLNLQTPSEQVKCLNVLQRLRGSVIPGYVSLFKKTHDATNLIRELPAEEYLEELLSEYEVAAAAGNNHHRQRTANTI